jgi:hypothetical protein
MTFFLWYLIASSILGLGFGYLGWRLISISDISTRWKRIGWGTLSGLFIFLILSIILQTNAFEEPTGIIAWVTYIFLGLGSSLLTLVVIRDLLFLLVRGWRKGVALWQRAFGRSSVETQPIDEGRRQLLMNTVNLAIMGVAGTMTAYGIYEARRRPALITVDIPIPNLHPDLEGFRILQLTDIHAGLTIRKGFVETIAEMTDELKGDLIAFTGDLVDGTVSELRDDVSPMEFLRAPYGKFFVTGNHEYYSGVEPWVEEADRLGFTVLNNEHRVIQKGDGRILLAGVTDFSGGQFAPSHASNPVKAVENAPASDVRILLAHQPKSLYQALPLGFDLQISGHTHGGQFFPWNLLATLGQPYISGLHRHEKTWVYVSRGSGYWGPPVRLAARSEVTVLRLTRSEAGFTRNAELI